MASGGLECSHLLEELRLEILPELVRHDDARTARASRRRLLLQPAAVAEVTEGLDEGWEEAGVAAADDVRGDDEGAGERGGGAIPQSPVVHRRVLHMGVGAPRRSRTTD